MAGRVRALLVGIDAYVGDVPPLAGCGNDVTAMTDLLTSLVGDRLDLRVLRDDGATRAAVVEAFQSHLGGAEADDVALFYYSGHGSNEPAPEEFWGTEPDRRNETLVCVDSRTETGRDLADKELAALVAQVSARAGHVLVVLDCCHSGSGARGERRGAADQAVRLAPPDDRPRTLDSYLVPVRAPAAAGAPRARIADGAGRTILSATTPARYVLLAGCEASQTSKEQTIDGRRRGVFTLSLETALRSANGRISYADLLSWATTRVRGLVADQTPQLEVTEDADRTQPFLGGAVSPGGYALLLHTADGWQVDAGALHGVPEPCDGESVAYGVYHQDSTPEDRRSLAARVAAAVVTEVGPARSLVAVEPLDGAALDETAAYLAVPVTWPVPPLRVSVTGDPGGVVLVTEALAGRPELALADPAVGADLVVHADGDAFEIRRPADGTLACAPLPGGADVGGTLAGRLERIARWHRVRELANPQTRLTAEQVRLEITLDDGTAAPPGAITLEQPADGSRNPGVRVTVHNEGPDRLFVATLGLTSQYAVVNLLEPSPGEWVEPGGSLAVHGGEPITLEVPEGLHRLGITEVADDLTVVVSTAAFDAGALTQPELDASGSRTAYRTAPAVSTLDAYLRRVGTRGFARKAAEGTVADWIAWTRTILTRRPLEDAAHAHAGGDAG